MTLFMNNRLMVPAHDQGILDFAPGAAAAYSLRNLSYAYNGPVVTVRRSTDSAEADFTANEVSDGTLAAWCGGGDGFVKQWWDQSGNARHATASGSAQPQIVDSGVLVTEGGKAAVQFDGTDDYLAFTTPDSLKANATKTIISVSRGTGDAALDFCVSTRAVGSVDGYAYFVFESTEDVWYAHIGKGQAEYADAVANNSHVILFLVTGTNGTGVALQVDGATKTKTANTLTAATSETAGNQTWIGKQSTSLAAMRMNELLFYPADMTASRQRIEANMAWYF